MTLKAGDYAAAIRLGNELLSMGYRKSELYNLISRGVY